MTIDELVATLADAQPPVGLPGPVLALWHDGHGDWEAAHRVVQEDESPAAAWVHAYLHRKEGDLGNAGYWYRRAGRSVSSGSLEGEWRAIGAALLREEGPG